MSSFSLPPQLFEQLREAAQNNKQSIEDFITEILSDHHKQEVDLSESEVAEQLKLAVKAARIGIWKLDLRNNHLDWNDELLTIYGITRDQFENDLSSWQDAVHPNDRSYAEGRLTEAFNGNEVYDVIFRIFRPDGEMRYINGSATPIFAQDGTIIKVIGNNQDITDIIHAQHSVLDQETILSQISDAVITTDNNFVIKSWNQKAEEIYGWKHHEVLGKVISDFVVTQYVDDDPANVQSTFEQTGYWQGEVIQKNKSGEDIFILASVSRILEVEGGNEGVVAINRDITARKKAELLEKERHELERELRQEKEIAQLRAKMLSTIAHEFRTPLSIILSSSELLVRYGDRLSPEKQEHSFKKIANQIKHLNNMIEQLSVVAMSEQNALRPDFELTDIAEFCETMVADFRDTLRADQELIDNIDTSVGSYVIDPSLLYIGLGNIISNAIKYSSEHGRITFKARKIDNMLEFEVSDNGIGIPEHDQASIFMPFHRATNVEKVRGTGLGLSIVKQVVDLHRGTIRFASLPNTGTQFVITLPTNLEPST